MTTFILKKYEEPENSTNAEQEQKPQETQASDKEQITVEIKGSISQIVADALYRLMPAQTEEEKQTEVKGDAINVTTLSTEEINEDPIGAFSKINKGDVVYIQNKGFHTAKEEWFLTNLPNKTNDVFYSVESLAKHFKAKTKASWDEN